MHAEGPIVSYGLDKLHCDIRSAVSCRMRAAPGPVDPCHAPVGCQRSMEHVQISWDVVLIRVAGRLAMPSEEGVVLVVCDYVHGYLTVELKPLRAFPPMIQHDLGRHVPAVSATALLGVLVVGLNEAVG